MLDTIQSYYDLYQFLQAGFNQDTVTGSVRLVVADAQDELDSICFELKDVSDQPGAYTNYRELPVYGSDFLYKQYDQLGGAALIHAMYQDERVRTQRQPVVMALV